MDQKQIATKLVRSLNLQPEMRTRALILVAADTAPGSSLRELLRLNDDAEDLNTLVVSFLEEEARGRSRSARCSATCVDLLSTVLFQESLQPLSPVCALRHVVH